VFNINGFYDPIVSLIDKGLEEKFLRSDTPDLFKPFTEKEVDEMIAYLEMPVEEDNGKVESKYGA